ncbi:hypothetical protein AB0J83_11075 [Actinoplanes sp. NPDC049596]|uniref:hypothetical protein n=1 Tax=unclassified Actinoplanes TaxID=2626549 RepID=UPI00342A9D13
MITDLDQLRSLDPARDYEPTPERRARATAALDQMFHRPRPAGRRLAFGAAALAAAAAVAFAAVQLMPTGHGNRAYASWTPTPRAAAGAEVLPQALQCAAGWTDWKTPPTAADVVLAEKRGDTSLLLISKDGTDLTSCLILDPAQGPAGAELLDRSAPPPAADQVSTQTMSATEGTHGWYSAVVGRAGADVTRVEIKLPDGTVVRATVKNGWWAAWWPGHEGGEADAVRVVTHAKG